MNNKLNFTLTEDVTAAMGGWNSKCLFLNLFGYPLYSQNFSRFSLGEKGKLDKAEPVQDLIKIFNKKFGLSLEPFSQRIAYSRRQKMFRDDDALYLDIENFLMLDFEVYSDDNEGFPIIDINLRYQTLTEKIKDFIGFLSKHHQYKTPHVPMIKILGYNGGGFYTNSFKIKDFEIDINTNYNNDFVEIDKLTKDFLIEDDVSGLIMYHGIYGSGKTFYIRHLLKWASEKMKNSSVIYIPPNMSGRLSDPTFVPFLLEQVGSTIIIEDAEQIVQSRNEGGGTGVSDILNLTDGILGDVFKLKIILSFNMHLDKIDGALLRKGRLKAKYEFKELTEEKSNALLEKLGKKDKVNKSMPLCDIYNYEDKSFKEEKKVVKLGF